MDSPPSEVSPDDGGIRGRSDGNHRKRVRVWTEDDRAKHRIFEKNRREAFGDSLLALARFLPNLTSVKESKLSKHTIVDESLKYHEVQQAKLDELQNDIEALRAEKEALLTEVSGWRQCLEVPLAQQPVTSELCGPSVVQDTGLLNTTHHSNAIYGGVPAGFDEPLDLPALAAGASFNLLPTDFSNDHAIRSSEMPRHDVPDLNNMLSPTRNMTQGDFSSEPPHHGLWSPPRGPHIPQASFMQPSYQEIPLEYHQHPY